MERRKNSTVEGRANTLGHALRKRGHRLTSSRRIILETLVDCEGHVSAEELAAMVNHRDDRVSRMTIYRTLDLLRDLGWVRPVIQGTRAARFILMEDGSHHHFICSDCNAVFELNDCRIEGLLDSLEGAERFRVQAHLLELYGICDECQKS